MTLRQRLSRLHWHRLGTVATLGVGLASAFGQAVGITPFAADAGAYWAARPGDLYTGWDMRPDGYSPYLYSPAFADVLTPLRVLPVTIFSALWQFMLFMVMALVARGWSILFVLAAVPSIALHVLEPLNLVMRDIWLGNINVLLGAIAVVGLRRPYLWAIPFLSKVTPGVGIVWFLARREWTNLSIALATTAVIALVSFIHTPADWIEWLTFLRESSTYQFPQWVVPIPLVVRLAMSVTLIWWGARTDRAWVVPVAVGWAIPMPYPTFLAAVAFAIPVWFDGRRVAFRQPVTVHA